MKRSHSSATHTVLILTFLKLAGLATRGYPAAAEGAHALPLPAVDVPPGQAASAVVVLAGGCFWGVQGAINDLPKIEDLKRFFTELYRPVPVLVAGVHASQ
jgi:hypothetical protein